MNDNDMSEMFKKAQDMIKNNQIPDNLKEMVNNFQRSGGNFNSGNNSSNNVNNSYGNSANNQSNNQSNNSQVQGNGQNNANFSMPDIDMETLMKMQSIMSKMKNNPDDDMSKLLSSLKPYMRDEKKGKVDDYMKLIKMGKMAQIFDAFGGEKK